MEDSNFRKGDAKTAIFGSEKMLQASPVDKIPDGPTTPEIAYQMVKDETFAQTQPRLNLATFVTTYMDDYATKLMNEAININYIDETEYPRIAVMNAKCINIVANLWNTPELRYFYRISGCMGKIRPALADRNAPGASDIGEDYARSRRSIEDV